MIRFAQESGHETESRNAQQDSIKQFGLPGSRKYPMPDKNHAMVAKGRATQMLNKGKLLASSAAKIRSEGQSNSRRS